MCKCVCPIAISFRTSATVLPEPGQIGFSTEAEFTIFGSCFNVKKGEPYAPNQFYFLP